MKKKYLEPTAEMLVLVNKTAFICASVNAAGNSTTRDLVIDNEIDVEW